MADAQMTLLREHMRDHLENSRVADLSLTDTLNKIVSLRRPPQPVKNPGVAVLDLVNQAAELFGDLDKYAAERHARAEVLCSQAVEKLKIANDHVRSADSARRAAEAEIKEFSDRVEKEVNIKVQEIEKAIEQMTSGVADIEARLSAAEQRARNAEKRAEEAENAFKLIERTIRTRILEKRFDGSSGRVATAA